MANQHNFPLIGQAFVGTKILSASITLTGTDSGKAFNNSTATGAITASLPKAVPGRVFKFLCQVAHNLVIQPQSVDVIRGSTAGTATTLSSAGTHLYLECWMAGFWEII